ncbi:MAG: hypothetical protein DRG78_23295 [Epsilonproteobacteria bacterium]|nr:MAG: hypothetical protein DRG78_23295 [Campylobacterota bacterium]
MGIIAYRKIIVYLFVLLMFLSSLNASVYKIYSQWEVDSVFVAWLINRYVDRESEFIVVEKGMSIDNQYAINTPNSRFRRSAKETAFESALRQFKISNSCTDKLIPIIRVVELAPWRKSEYLYILNFESDIVRLLNEENISAAFDYIDSYCKEKKR